MTGGSHVVAEEILERLRHMRGCSTQEIRSMRREFTKRLKSTPPEEVMGIAEKLLESPESVRRWVAFELIHHHEAALSQITPKNLEKFGQGISSWIRRMSSAFISPGQSGSGGKWRMTSFINGRARAIVGGGAPHWSPPFR